MKERRRLSDTIKELTDAINESSQLVRAVDKLVKTFRESSIMKSVSRSEMMGEVIEYEDSVMVVQEVGYGVAPRVKYDGSSFIIEAGGKTFTHEVGCVDKESIEAEVRNGVLTIKARRCKDESDRENKEPVQKE